VHSLEDSVPLLIPRSLSIAVPSPFSALDISIAYSTKDYNLDLFKGRPSSDTLENVQTPSMKNAIEYVEDLALKADSMGRAKGGEGMRQASATYKKDLPEMTDILEKNRSSWRYDLLHGGAVTLY